MHQTRTTLTITDHSRFVCPQYELASCHPPGTKNLEVTTRFLDYLYTPVFIHVITFQFICTISLLVPHLMSLQIYAPLPLSCFTVKRLSLQFMFQWCTGTVHAEEQTGHVQSGASTNNGAWNKDLSRGTLKYNVFYITEKSVFRIMRESLEVSSSSDKEVYLYFGFNEFRK